MRRSRVSARQSHDLQMLGFGLAAARALWGTAQFMAPDMVDRWVRRPATTSTSSGVGWRMKGVRDLAVGLGTLTAPSDALSLWFRVGIAVDAGDTVATLADRRRTLKWRVVTFGTMAGIMSVIVGAAAADSSET